MGGRRRANPDLDKNWGGRDSPVNFDSLKNWGRLRLNPVPPTLARYKCIPFTFVDTFQLIADP